MLTDSREPDQAEALDRPERSRHRWIDAVVLIEVDDALIVDRISGRRSDRETVQSSLDV